MPPTILIVDDEPDLEVLIRQRFRRQIREGVYDFTFAANGAAALNLIRAGGVDLVLSDINMPVMDGLTLLGHLRGLRPRLGAVIVSAYGDMRNIRAAMNLGAHDFLTKPIDFHDFEITVNKMLRQIEEQRQAEADRDRLLSVERDLQTAAEIQQSFLPPPLVPAAGATAFDLAAVMLPARIVGGDFYDYFLLDDGRLAVAVGDVSGKGVPAALYMAVTRTLLRAAAQQCPDPGQCLGQVNRRLLGDSPSAMFVSLFYGVLDLRTGTLLYSLGGHPWPYLVRAGGAAEGLTARGLLVGVFKEAVYETAQVALRPGDDLFLYTDGVTEAYNAGGEFFAAQGLEATLLRADRSTPEALVRGVLAAVRQFAGPGTQSDDLTALAVRYNGPPP